MDFKDKNPPTDEIQGKKGHREKFSYDKIWGWKYLEKNRPKDGMIQRKKCLENKSS